MKKNILFLILAVLVVGGVAMVYVLQKQNDLGDRQRTGDRLHVAATIFPLYDMVRQVGGEQVDVELIVPMGASPHLFSFTPREVARLQEVQAVFSINYGLDNWISQILEGNSSIKNIVVDRGVPLRSITEMFVVEEDEHEEEDEGPYDPHYFLSLDAARIITQTIATSLSELDPVHQAVYQERARIYAEELQKTKEELQQRIAPFKGQSIITLHDAWYYFAEEFGLKVIASFEPAAGEEPTPKYLAAIRDVAQKNNVRVIFAEPQLSNQSLEAFAGDLGLRIATLDPEGGFRDNDTFLKQMRYNVNTIAENFEKVYGTQ